MVAKTLGSALGCALGRTLALMLVCSPAALALGLGDIRLLSPLNAPLDAEIELLGATQEELGALEARIASRDTFERYGLDWPTFLNGISVEADRTRDGRDIVRLRSLDPVTEPFLTLLVEVNWARGRLVREYTMLLDPPVYTPGQPDDGPQVAVAAPSAGAGAREGSIARGSDQPARQPSAPSRSSTPSLGVNTSFSGTDEGTRVVVRGDTLSGIAAEIAGGNTAEARSWTLAIYQANPAAFDGNMNILRAGATLRIPSATEAAAVVPSEATAEIRRQYAAWRASTPAVDTSASGAGRLRLVTPDESAGGGASGERSEALQARVRELESQLSESQRLLELRNAELADLQARLAQQGGEAEAEMTPAEPAQTAATNAEEVPLEEPGAEAVSGEDPALAQVPAEEEEAPIAVEPEEPIAAIEEPVTARAAPQEQSASLLDTVKEFWWIIALLGAALLALFGVKAWRSRQSAEFDDSLGRLAAAGAESMSRGFAAGDTAPLRPPPAVAADAAFLVEESGSHERPRFDDDAAPAPAPRHVPADETMSSETAINLDQGDPLAEADFHMAYGLYDQAADLVRIAIAREPERRDLKLKLLEVFFVWGNKDQFLQTARELAESRAEAAPGEWEKIVIMGKQLAPDDPLFSGGGAVSGAAAGGVDLDLEGGQNRVDFDVLGDGQGASEGGLDLDIGSALGDADADPSAATGRNTHRDLALHEGLDSGSTGTTREMTAQMTARMPVGGSDDSDMLGDLGEAPTVEQPALRSDDNPTIRQKVEMALKQGGSGDQTAELAIDDLGLDLSGLDTMDQPGLGASPDAPTMVAGLDEHSRRVMEDAERRSGSHEQEDLSLSGSWNLNIDDQSPTMPPNTVRALGNGADDGSETSRLAALKGSEVDFDIGEADYHHSEHGGGHGMTNGSGGVDLDVGTATVPDTAFAATQKLNSDDLALPDLEPVTMSEVGTKLDLARAYMDMGDPEGARNILEEVLTEGSVAQKQEAQRLLESLPG